VEQKIKGNSETLHLVLICDLSNLFRIDVISGQRYQFTADLEKQSAASVQ